jgi:hypothetical protein
MCYLTTLDQDGCNKLEALLIHNEKYMQFPYDDMTGLQVTAPKGNITWLIGINLATEGSMEIALLFTRRKLVKIESEILNASGSFQLLSTIRKIVLFDMAYNLGVQGLMTFTKMWNAIEAKDWSLVVTEMQASKWDKQTGLRSQTDEKMMLSDEWCGL